MKIYYIYCITNLMNDKTYIGQHKTENLNDSYMGSGLMITKSIRKYGKNNFSKEILAITGTKQNADILEKCFIALYREIGKAEYNLATGGTGGQDGRKHTEQEKNKISKASAEHWNKEGYREKVSKAISKSLTGKKRNEPAWIKGKSPGYKWFTNGIENKLCKQCPEGFFSGRTISESEKQKLRTCNIGRTHTVTEETRKKISETQKKNPNRSMLGRKQSLEAKQKLSRAHTGKKLSNETKEKIKRFMTGKKMAVVDGKRTWIEGN